MKQRRRMFNYLVSYSFTLKDGRSGNGSKIVDINSSVIYTRFYTKLYDLLKENSDGYEFKTLTIANIQRLN